MAEEKEGKGLLKKGWLKKAFTGAVKFATVGLAAAVAWQLFLDPLFFMPIHDPTNIPMQAWVGFMNDWFGWIPDLVGATGDGGLLQSKPVKKLLSKYFNDVTPPDTEELDAGNEMASEVLSEDITGISADMF